MASEKNSICRKTKVVLIHKVVRKSIHHGWFVDTTEDSWAKWILLRSLNLTILIEESQVCVLWVKGSVLLNICENVVLGLSVFIPEPSWLDSWLNLSPNLIIAIKLEIVKIRQVLETEALWIHLSVFLVLANLTVLVDPSQVLHSWVVVETLIETISVVSDPALHVGVKN